MDDKVIYDFFQENNKKGTKKKITIGVIIVLVIIAALTANDIYLEILQLDEIGGYSDVYMKNLIYKLISFAICFVLVFVVTFITNIFLKKNLNNFRKKNGMPPAKLPSLLISLVAAFVLAFLTKEMFYMKFLTALNGSPFGSTDPVFLKDIGYYIFNRPFFITAYGFLSTVSGLIIAYTFVYYLFNMSSFETGFSFQNIKDKGIISHNLVNVAIFFILKAVSYRYTSQNILYDSFSVLDNEGAGYVDVNIWMLYYKIAPYLILVVVAVALFLVWRNRLKAAGIAIAVFPAVWVITIAVSAFTQSLIVSPNEMDYEKQYISYNIEKTREAYSLDKIKTYDFPEMEELTPEIIQRNIETKNNIRVVDIASTLVSNVQLQSNTAFYTFTDGDIINYTVNGKEIPIFISAREIDKSRLPDKTYLNTTYRYTHGYGIVMNPINQFTNQGQVDFILSGTKQETVDENLVINRPEIYYGEMTNDHVIVKAKGLEEIDYDGTRTTIYEGEGGIQLNLLNKLLFSIKYADFNMLISGYTNDATLLLNREIVGRAQKVVPFLTVDEDACILLTDEGRLKWVLDAYTTTEAFPYAQSYGDVNYIRNSVKIVIDAYDGKAQFYIIDDTDPIINTYDKIYPGLFIRDPLPEEISNHLRYPELLFKIQTEMLNKYHILPENFNAFYSQQDKWDIAKYASTNEAAANNKIDPYYNMIKLPGGLGEKEELILMRPFTPAGELKHNMVSWLAVRNSSANYGEMILFNFPKNTNIYGPNQIEVKINQIDKISTDMTLWGQGGSKVYKGNLLVIPIENSVLYVEPIYIQSQGTSSIPEVREIVVGYQTAEDFRFGIGTNLDNALADLFKGQSTDTEAGAGNNAGGGGTSGGGTGTGPDTPVQPADPDTSGNVVQPGTTVQPGGGGQTDNTELDQVKQKLEELKNQINELSTLIEQLD